MHILDLPIEISNKIFSYTNKYDLLQCALACKSWEIPALQSLYGNLTLNAYNVYFLKSKLKLDVDELDGYFKFGYFTKTLVISYDEKDDLAENFPEGTDMDSIPDDVCAFNKDELIFLLEYLPNLSVLILNNSAHVAKYYQYILETPSVRCLNQIQSIPYKDSYLEKFHTSDIYDMNFLICYKYRATITNLVVHYKCPMIDVDSSHDRTLTFVSHFTKLADLTLVNTFDHQLTLFDIQKMCPNLTLLNYITQCKIPDIILEDYSHHPTNRDLTRHLKTLKLDVPSVTAALVNYLTDYVPPQVDTLHITMNDTDLCDWIDSIGMNHALMLATRLGTAEHAKLDFVLDRRYHRKSDLAESKMTLLFKLIGALKANKEILCHAQYKEFSSIQDMMTYDVDKGITFRYSIERENLGPDFLTKNSTESKDNIKSLIIGPAVIHSMQVILRMPEPNMIFRYLNYALEHSPNLHHFHFRFGYNLYQGIRITTDRNHAKTNQKVLSERTTAENMTVVRIGDIIPSVDLLNLISTHLPNIEDMSCGSPNWNRAGIKTAEIDLTAFKNLIKFYYNLSPRRDIPRGRATILLQYKDGSEKCYSQVGESNRFDEVPLDYFTDIKNTQVPEIFFITIKCNKNTRLFICIDENLLIAELADGEFIDHTAENNIQMLPNDYFFV